MKKVLGLVLLLASCTTIKKYDKTYKKSNLQMTMTYDPKVWAVQDLTTEDSIKLDSLIKLNH